MFLSSSYKSRNLLQDTSFPNDMSWLKSYLNINAAPLNLFLAASNFANTCDPKILLENLSIFKHYYICNINLNWLHIKGHLVCM